MARGRGRRKLKKVKVNMSRKEKIIMTASIGIPVLIIIIFNIALVIKHEPLAEQPRILAKLYFKNPAQGCLVPEDRQIEKKENLEDQIKEIFINLKEGPVSLLNPVVHYRLNLEGIAIVENKIVLLTLNDFFLKHPTGYPISQTLRQSSIVNTLIDSVPEIKGVVLKIDEDPPLEIGSLESPLQKVKGDICGKNPPSGK